MSELTELALKVVKRSAEHLIDMMKEELEDQGHNLTGFLSDSIVYKVTEIPDGFKASIYVQDYGIPLNTGVKANRIPYMRGSGAGKSKYIEGLTQFALLRHLASNLREAKQVAFAIANKHKKEGMPTRDSYVFSANGRRKDWINVVAEQQEDVIKKAMMSELKKGLYHEVYKKLKQVA